MATITTKKRTVDFHACLNGDETLWEAGRTEAEAIGKLVISHAVQLGIQVLNQQQKKDKEA